MIYWVLFSAFSLLFAAELFCVYPRRLMKSLFIVSIITLFVISSIRWERGSDWEAYYSLFRFSNIGYWDTHFEKGYVILNQLIRRCTDNYSVFLLIQAAIYYFLLYRLAEKINRYCRWTEKTSYFTILLFLYTQNFAGLFSGRTELAYMICFLAIFDVIENRKISFVIKLCLAVLFHTLSIIIVLLWPVYYLFKYSKKYVALLTVLGSAGFELLAFAPTILNKIGLGKYLMYVSDNQGSLINLGLFKWIVVFIVLTVSMNYLDVNDEIDTNHSVLLQIEGGMKVLGVGIVLYLYFLSISTVALRAAGLIIDSAIIMIMPSINHITSKNMLKLLFVFQVLLGVVSLWGLLNGSYRDLYLPYKTLWDTFDVITY